MGSFHDPAPGRLLVYPGRLNGHHDFCSWYKLLLIGPGSQGCSIARRAQQLIDPAIREHASGRIQQEGLLETVRELVVISRPAGCQLAAWLFRKALYEDGASRARDCHVAWGGTQVTVKFIQGRTIDRVPKGTGDLAGWLEDKVPECHARVRQFQVVGSDDEVVIKQQVQVHGTRTPPNITLSTQLVFQQTDFPEQLARGKGGIQKQGTIKKSRLVGWSSHRGCFQDGAGSNLLDTRKLPYCLAGLVYQARGVPEIRSKGNQATGHLNTFPGKK